MHFSQRQMGARKEGLLRIRPACSAEAVERDVKSQLHEPSPILQYWENILCLLTTPYPSTQETKRQALLFPASLHVGVGVGMTHTPTTAQAPQILLSWEFGTFSLKESPRSSMAV